MVSKSIPGGELASSCLVRTQKCSHIPVKQGICMAQLYSKLYGGNQQGEPPEALQSPVTTPTQSAAGAVGLTRVPFKVLISTNSISCLCFSTARGVCMSSYLAAGLGAQTKSGKATVRNTAVNEWHGSSAEGEAKICYHDQYCQRFRGPPM